jgi:hypothetical protein
MDATPKFDPRMISMLLGDGLPYFQPKQTPDQFFNKFNVQPGNRQDFNELRNWYFSNPNFNKATIIDEFLRRSQQQQKMPPLRTPDRSFQLDDGTGINKYIASAL